RLFLLLVLIASIAHAPSDRNASITLFPLVKCHKLIPEGLVRESTNHDHKSRVRSQSSRSMFVSLGRLPAATRRATASSSDPGDGSLLRHATYPSGRTSTAPPRSTP